MSQNYNKDDFEVKLTQAKVTLENNLPEPLPEIQNNLATAINILLNQHLGDFSARWEYYQKQLEELQNSVTKLSRIQYKANTLSEAQEQKTTLALSNLQEVLKHQQQLQEEILLTKQQSLVKERSQTRCEFAIELLPVLDGIESAIYNGHTLLKRGNLKKETSSDLPAIIAIEQKPIMDLKKLSFWQRLVIVINGEIPLEQNPILENKVTNLGTSALINEKDEALTAWLTGLELVRERFMGLLATEGIRPIETEGQSFDPRLHIAVETIEKRDVPAGTISAVLRKGYKQENRVLRYSEVVVTKQELKNQNQ